MQRHGLSGIHAVEFTSKPQLGCSKPVAAQVLFNQRILYRATAPAVNAWGEYNRWGAPLKCNRPGARLKPRAAVVDGWLCETTIT